MTLPFCQLRILVAESDNATRRLMAQTLEKMGAAVVMAGNGREAVAHFAADHFDLVFMGLALPETDGFAATAAMTMLRASGERDRCLAAGMDSYIEKPSSASQIQVALLAFTNPESLQPIRPPPTWDRMRILERVGGDENFLAELIAIFAKEKSKLLGQMERALVECKPELLQQSAHDLQDQLNYLGAFEVSETARQLGATSNQPTFMKTSEMTALLRSQLFATELAMSKA